MKKRFTVFNDADYLSRLSPEDRAFYQQFIAEYYYGRKPEDRSKCLHSDDQMRQRWNEQYKERHDFYSRGVQYELRASAFRSESQDDLIELIDLKREVIRISIVSQNPTGDTVGQRARGEVSGPQECRCTKPRPSGRLIRMPRPEPG